MFDLIIFFQNLFEMKLFSISTLFIFQVACQKMNGKVDINRLEVIRNASIDTLKNPVLLQNLILELGTNDEQMHEMPSIIIQHAGGLRIFQYPNQLAPYLILLSTLSITSYLEIGCRYGGNFMVTSEYLKRFNNLARSHAVDLHNSPVQEYTRKHNGFHFHRMNSQSKLFLNFMQKNSFDAIFIDGDHSYNGVKNDFYAVKGHARIYIFHDISSSACPGVSQFWNELKSTNEYIIHEFTEQYEEVTKRSGKQYLGIGVAIFP